MSSILEALRELESRRPPTTQSVAAPAEQPTTANRAVETLGIATIGLVLGALGFVVFIGISSVLRATGARESHPAVPIADEPAPARPAWLDTADPPRAQLGGRAGARPDELVRPGAESRAETSRPGRIEVAAIDYSPQAGRRAVTLRLDGSTEVTLGERQSARGIEVQLIQPDAVYLRSGAEVFMVSPGR